jgi:dienelactone hydrolase
MRPSDLIKSPSAAAFLLAVLATGQAAAGTLPAGRFVTQPMPVTVEIDGSRFRLDGLMVRPKGKGPFPLALVTHGSCGKSCRKKRSPAQLHDQANVFAEWGYATYVLIRRGNGTSDGPYAEGYGGCKSQNYVRAARATAADMAATLRHLAQLPYVDGSRMVAIGQSGGGIGVVALSGIKLPGLRAAINFAGGRGGSCLRRGKFDETEIADSYRSFGGDARIPGLWLYTQNDDYWGPKRPKRWHEAFTDGGGTADFIHLPPFRTKGHSFFYKQAAIPIWSPFVDKFLRQHGLPGQP